MSYKKILSTYLIWWVFWTFIQTMILHHLNLSWRNCFIDSLVTNTILGLAGYITQNTYRFYKPGNKSRIYRLAYGIALTVVCMTATKFILQQLLSTDKNYLSFLEASMPIRSLFTMLMISFFTILSWMWYYIQDQEKLNARKDDAEILLRDAELSRLKLQLQPHFLFNSLNSISALTVIKPEEARKMIQQLSDFLRGTLKKEDQQSNLLSEELEHLQLYVEIEKVRFGHRLNTVIENDEQSLQMKLPSLLLQPIVENAIKFGLYDTIGDITISIKSHVENNYLIVEVKNPYDTLTAKPKHGVGFGLNSVQRRLHLLYARQDLLTVSQIENIFTTTIKIPQTI